MDFQQRITLLQARLGAADFNRLLMDALYERGQIGEVLDDVQAAADAEHRARREEVDLVARASARSEMSCRAGDRQIAQRRMWGDLKPGQRSLNEPWPD